jgi:TFIIF-interacting CTD phosphatase-like protein
MDKLHVILDLDQTLISAEATEEYDFEKNKDKAKRYKYHTMDDYYIVFERPGLQEFLDYLFENFDVSVWTAATKDYALFIIKHIILKKKERRLINVFFSYHCNIAEKKMNGTKDLSTLTELFNLGEYPLDKTYIIDDYDEVYKTQPDNCLIAEPFYFTDKKSHEDDYLSKARSVLEKIKNANGDERASILEKFNKNNK